MVDVNRGSALPLYDRVLLVNPPVYDIRFPWAQYHQPATLLRLSTYYKSAGSEVRMVDALDHERGTRIRKERVSTLLMDGYELDKWRFGITRFAVKSELRTLALTGWAPDIVYIEGSTTFWWEGVAEVAEKVRERFPKARIALLGAYPALAPDHARQHIGADDVIDTRGELANISPDLSMHSTSPAIVFLTLGDGQRTADEIIEEIKRAKSEHKIQYFAFADHAPSLAHPELYRNVLEQIVEQQIGISLYALGNCDPVEFITTPDLPILMKQAGYVQIVFADNREIPLNTVNELAWIDNIREAAELCFSAGFRERTDAVTASICVGRRGEDLSQSAKLAIQASHYAGSIIFWPYQPMPQECSDLPLELQNGKLFPLRESNGVTYRDYLGVLSLGTVLNAKYRSRTFNFLGGGLIAGMFRDSLARHAWEPDPEIKGGIKLPMPLVLR